MLIEVWCDDYGTYLAEPKNKRLKAKIVQHLSDAGIRSDGVAFFQSREEVPDFILNHSNFESDVENGFPLSLRVDAWQFLHCYGYDTHTLAE